MVREPLPGKKTNLLAGLTVLLQAAAAAGYVDQPTAEAAQQVIAALMGLTLSLKLRR